MHTYICICLSLNLVSKLIPLSWWPVKPRGSPVSAPSSARVTHAFWLPKFYLNDPNPGPRTSTETSTALTEPSSYGPPDNNVFLRK